MIAFVRVVSRGGARRFLRFGLGGTVVFLSACVTTPVGGGLLLTSTQAPGNFNPSPVSSTVEGDLVGKASAVNILGLFALGDASLERAMENGGVKYVRNTDYSVFSLLGLFTKWTTVV